MTSPRHIISLSEPCKHSGSFSEASLKEPRGGPTEPSSLCVIGAEERAAAWQLDCICVFRGTLRV